MANGSVYQHGGLRFLRIPATLSTKIVVEDRENDTDEIRFEIRSGSDGTYNLMRWLTQKARAYEAGVFRYQRKSSRRAGSAKRPVSSITQRLVVKVLIKNTVSMGLWLTTSACFTDMSIVRNEWRRNYCRKASSLSEPRWLKAACYLEKSCHLR